MQMQNGSEAWIGLLSLDGATLALFAAKVNSFSAPAFLFVELRQDTKNESKNLCECFRPFPGILPRIGNHVNQKGRNMDRKKRSRLALLAVSDAAALGIGALSLYMLWEQPPASVPSTPPPPLAQSAPSNT